VTNHIFIQQPVPIEQGPSGEGTTRQSTECNHILIRMVRKAVSTWKVKWCRLQSSSCWMLHIAIKIARSLVHRHLYIYIYTYTTLYTIQTSSIHL